MSIQNQSLNFVYSLLRIHGIAQYVEILLHQVPHCTAAHTVLIRGATTTEIYKNHPCNRPMKTGHSILLRLVFMEKGAEEPM